MQSRTDLAQFSFRAAQEFAEHLRDHPESAGQAPRVLATEFRLPESFVKDVLTGLKPPQQRDDSARKALLDLKAKALESGRHVLAAFDHLVCRPTLFVLVTSLAAGLIGVITAFMLSGVIAKPSGAGAVIRLELPLNLVIGVAVALHLACYFRHGMVRHAFFGGLVVFGVLVPVGWAAVAFLSVLDGAPNKLVAFAAVTFVMAILAGLYTFVGFTTAVVGGYQRVRREVIRQDAMSRQDMLERLLSIRDRLSRSETGRAAPRSSRLQSLLAHIKVRPSLWALAAGLSFGMLSVLLIGGLTVGLLPSEAADSLVVTITETILLFVSIGLMSVLAFYSGGVRHGVLVAMLFHLASLVPLFLPLGMYGPPRALSELRLVELIPELSFAAVVGFFAGLGARVEERAALVRKLTGDDPAALLAESIRIQWRVAPHTQNVCVLVVDAARSSAMKAEADPLVAEWSFREYQKFIESISRRWEGSIHSTAGDGAVVEFHTPNEAFAAARAIQSEIEPFNRNVNRLASPFRVRIGIHMGDVQGDLEDVEYTEVIDIAAHLQEIAPVGGIAMTERVAACLEGEKLAQLRDEVDGLPVFLALNPTGI